MSKVVRLTESELTKIVKRVMSENESSSYEMYTRYIQRADDDLASCVQSTMQTLQDLKEDYINKEEKYIEVATVLHDKSNLKNLSDSRVFGTTKRQSIGDDFKRDYISL